MEEGADMMESAVAETEPDVTEEFPEELDNNDEETFGMDEEEVNNSANAEYQCDICKDKLKNPRVLACLHVFCLQCLQDLLNEANENVETSDDIICPSCTHKTTIKGRAAKNLLVAFVNGNIVDMEAVRAMTVVCTSCKSEDAAVARCADCANFLCEGCNQAHQSMRCFENHQVHSLAKLKESSSPIPIHKPVLCLSHPSETIKFFCVQCQLPTCSECITEHTQADHAYERVDKAEKAIREELKSLMDTVADRIDRSEDTGNAIIAALSDLEANHDQCRSLIEETFQSYRAVLEAERDNLMERLKKLHNERELAVMGVMADLETSRPHMDMAVAFTNALIELGDPAEIVASHRVVRDRLKELLRTPLEPKLDVSIEFESNFEDFQKAVQKTFGRFKSDAAKASPPSSPSPVSTSLINPLSVNSKESGIVSSENGLSGLLGSTMSIPTSGIVSSEGGSSPTSLQSCDSDLSTLSANFNMPSRLDITSPPLTQTTHHSPLSGLSMMDLNLQRLANLELDTSPTPQTNNPFTFADLLSAAASDSLASPGITHAMNNLQALAKLGENTDNTPGLLDGPQWPNMSNNRTSPDMSHLNGYNGMNGMSNSMNGMTARMNSLNGIANINGMGNGMNGLGHTMNGMGHSMNGLNGSMNDFSQQMMRGRMMGQGNLMQHQPSNAPSITGMNNMNASFPPPRPPNSSTNTMHVMHKYGQLGSGRSQFNSPHGFCLGVDEEVVVADTNNHRIQIFNKDGSYKTEFGTTGRDEGQLFYPRKVAVIKNTGKFVVCDRGNERSRMQIFTKNGHFVRKIGIRYIDIVAGLAVTQEGHIVAVDSVSPTVFILSEAGNLLHWFDCANYMREPSDIAISGDEYYVCDFKGHCVVVFSKDGTFQRRIGQEGVTNFPNGIDVSGAGDVLVGDSHGNRFHVTIFNREGRHVTDVECPYVKVSRCCGLKICRDGSIVTLAKNNHHVLVLSTIFLTPVPPQG